MINKEKILKQNSLRSGINIRFGLFFAGMIAVVGLIYAFGVPFSTIVVIYLGYKLLNRFASEMPYHYMQEVLDKDDER